MEEQRTYYLQQVNKINSTDNVTTPAIPDVSKPWLSTETCAYIHGGILATLFIIAMTR